MENNETYKLTEKGIQKLKDELHKLKTVDRERNLEALKEARSQGDLTENADYDSAREEQAQIEKRIKELENILKHAELIKGDTSNRVNIGKRVTLEINGRPEEAYTLVGTLEADPANKKLSNESPIGKAVIGRKKGETLTIKIDNDKKITIKIKDVK